MKKEKVTNLIDAQTFIEVGNITIGSGIREGYVWLENEEGEGTEVSIKNAERVLADLFKFSF